MAEFKCPFCGSKTLRIKSEYIELKSNGEYGAVENYCCLAQKQNATYVAKNFHPDDVPDIEEVSKW